MEQFSDISTKSQVILFLLFMLTSICCVSMVISSQNRVSAAQEPEISVYAPEVKSLSEERKITKTEARKRISWQDKASKLNKQFKQELPAEHFGGMWIDKNNDRVKIGIVNTPSSKDTLKKKVDDKVNQNALNEAADVVQVKYSYTELEAALEWITQQLMVADAKEKTDWPMAAEINTSENRIVLTLPVSDSQMTKKQTNLLKNAQKRYGDMIQITRSSAKAKKEACNWNYCNNPLRGGIPLHGSGRGYSATDCTAGFVVRGASGQKYILTAGHCKDSGSGWATQDTAGNTKRIGSIKHHQIYRNGGHDGMTIDINNDYNWQANGWVFLREGSGSWDGPTRNEEYDIVNTSTSGELQYQRVCKSGAVFGASCGPVQSPNVSFEYEEGFVIRHLVRASYCATRGDSGAPVIRNHSALGMHVLSVDAEGPDCTDYKYYAGIEPILRAFKDEIGSKPDYSIL